ncbi:uncharacterized protein LOC141695716 [Apium graveolens]|uniref:uncharacterized protein LOC141695716 n=1 Tax=Apium graveolens TaxID=4045 RepID=UPI003D798EF3
MPILPNQSAFIEGRLLIDNALITFEINHYIKRRSQGKNGVAGLKIDVSKAYEWLEWNFIEGMLQKYGFQEVWIQRIMVCIKTVSYSFIQKGTVFGEVRPQRGIRQGDPISPYLYILCAEGLSSIIKRNEEVGLLHGCSIARRAPVMSHLLFADDYYFFFKAVESEARVMQRIIKRYETLSGQAVNFNKSTITFSPNTNADTRETICDILGVRESTSPGKYLGIPMTVGRKKSEVFKFLTDRVRQKVQNWKNASISKAGEVCNVIQRQMNIYWWSNGNNSKGAKYYPNTDFLNATLGENPSYMWRSVLSAQEVIKKGCRGSIGTGTDTYVWKVPWLPSIDNGYLTTSMPSELANTKVCDLMEIQEKKWDDVILRDLFNERDAQLIQQIPLYLREFAHEVWDSLGMLQWIKPSPAISLLASWKVAQLERARSISKAAGTSMQKWQAPQKNWLKINIDAATFTDLRSIGIGAVIRDENDGFVRAMCKQVRGTWSPREVEGLSLKEALSWVKQHGFKCCVFETDSKLLAEACNGNP